MDTGTLVIIVKGGQVLLGLKKTGRIGKGTWNGPGGHLEKSDQSLLGCAIRETEEEVGIVLDAETTEKVAIITAHVGEKPDFKIHVFRATSFVGEPYETASMLPRWFPVGNLPLKDMLGSDAVWFPDAVTGKKFCANVFYEKRAQGFLRIESFPFRDSE